MQPENASSPIVVTASGIVIFSRLVQHSKADAPIVFTLSEIVTLARLAQPLNASYPIVVTLLPIITFLRLRQPRNALTPIAVIPSGIVYSVAPQPIAYKFNTPSRIRQRLSSDAIFPLNSFRLTQPQNAYTPIVVTLSGKVILVRLLQPAYLQPVITQYFASNKSEIWS